MQKGSWVLDGRTMFEVPTFQHTNIIVPNSFFVKYVHTLYCLLLFSILGWISLLCCEYPPPVVCSLFQLYNIL